MRSVSSRIWRSVLAIRPVRWDIGSPPPIRTDVRTVLKRYDLKRRAFDPLNVFDLVVRERQDDFRKLDARGIDGRRIVAEVSCNAFPGFLESLAHNLQCFRSVGRTFDELLA